MKWFEYQMEVDELKAPDELKARLLAMQTQPQRPSTPPDAQLSLLNLTAETS